MSEQGEQHLPTGDVAQLMLSHHRAEPHTVRYGT